ncbi:uracil-DNA glycosylase [uncultured Victivallis sp.]|uniref:uracil-DNA glycosylase n=1 Tax=uncultured Victivallis sp. TaxID=354118 RepID=UPI0025CFCA68|nr:uracil-DNA glycosylase [uncultured Victivallis sp.]
MAEEFFQQLIDCMKREAKRHPGHLVTEETLRAFMAEGNGASAMNEGGKADAPLPPKPVRSEAVPRESRPVIPPSVPPAPECASTAGKQPETLEELREIVLQCQKCPLAPTRHTVVFGEGNPHARLMFVGEGPGEQEDLQGRPFVGPAGQLLDRMILAMQFTREEVYIANVVKCRPPHNRNPEPEEADACRGYLARQIELIQPEVIVVLGAVAARFLLQRREGITRLRGHWLGYNGIPVMPTFHPSYLLRDPSGKRLAWSDLQQVMKVFGKVYRPASR